MTDFITDEQFLEAIKDFNSFITKPSLGYDIVIREPQYREFDKGNGLSFREGGTLPQGDIVVFPKDEDVYLFIGAKFELDNLVESFLRKAAYDTIFNYPNVHKIDLWSPGKRGSAFNDEDTPYHHYSSQFEKDFGPIESRLRRDYERAKLYLRTIDSPEFKGMVKHLHSETYDNLSIIIKKTENDNLRQDMGAGKAIL